MKVYKLIMMAVACCVLSACGDSSKKKEALRSELFEVRSEMQQVQMAMVSVEQQAQYAQQQAYSGSYNVGHGLAGDNGLQAIVGGLEVLHADDQYQKATRQFNEYVVRLRALGGRAAEIEWELNLQ